MFANVQGLRKQTLDHHKRSSKRFVMSKLPKSPIILKS